MKKNEYTLYTIAGITGIILAGIFLMTLGNVNNSSETALITKSSSIVIPDFFASTTLIAKAAYVYDIKDERVLYSKDADESLPLASLTKLMTAVTALSNAPTSTVVTITPQALAQEGDNGFYGDERWSIDDLLRFTLVASSNDGAEAIAEAVGGNSTDATLSTLAFVDKMNVQAAELGLSNTRFSNPTGLDISSSEAGAYGSAKDVGTLLTYASKNYFDIIGATNQSQITVTSLNYISHTALNTDELVGTIPNLIAGKTGYTDLAGGNLAVLVESIPNHPVVIVVLGSTYDGRFSDVEKLAQAAKETILSHLPSGINQ